jgi:hypothetical protein
MEKLIVCSVPKSGTYLIAQLLTELGYRNSGLHLNVAGFTDYRNADLSTARRDSDRLTVAESLSKSLRRIQEGEFAVGHLPPSSFPLLQGFRIIFLYRNIRDVLVSFCRWTADTGRWKDDGRWREQPADSAKLLGFLQAHGKILEGAIAEPAGWIAVPGIVSVSFEELMGDEGVQRTQEALRRIVNAVGCEPLADSDLLACLERAKSTETLTRSNGRSLRDHYWSQAVEREYVRRGYPLLNARLGYQERAVDLRPRPWRSLRMAFRKLRQRWVAA